IKTDDREEQRERNRQSDDQRSTNVAQEREQNQTDKNDSFGQIVQHRVRGQVDQIATVQVRNDLYAGRKEVFIQEVDFFVQRLQNGIRVGAFAEEHDAGNDVVIVHNLTLFVMDRFAHLPQANLGAGRDQRDIADANRSSVLRLEHRHSDVGRIFNQA